LDATKSTKFQYICCVPPSGPLYPGAGAQWADFLSRKVPYSESCERDRNNRLIPIIDNWCSI